MEYGVLTTPLEVLLDGAELCEQRPVAERRSRRVLRALRTLRTRVRGVGGGRGGGGRGRGGGGRPADHERVVLWSEREDEWDDHGVPAALRAAERLLVQGEVEVHPLRVGEGGGVNEGQGESKGEGGGG